MATSTTSTLCYQANGGTCKNLDISKLSIEEKTALAQDETIDLVTQLALAKDESDRARYCLATNTSPVEELQVKLAGDKSWEVRRALARNPSPTKEAAIKLISKDHIPYGIARDKSISELWEKKDLIMAGDYQGQFGGVFLSQLIRPTQMKPEDESGQLAEQRKLLILLAFDKFAKDKDKDDGKVSYYRDAILKVYPGDQEIAYFNWWIALLVGTYITMRITKLCFEVNDGDCKNKVSALNNYICAAGHGKGSNHNISRPVVPISKMSQEKKRELAKSTEDKTLQLELFRKEGEDVLRNLAQNRSIDDDLQWKLFHDGNDWVQLDLAQNPSIGEALQWKLFCTKDEATRSCLADNTSMRENLAIELAKVGHPPYGYVENKALAELVQPENLSLLNQYPKAFSQAYLNRLLNSPQEDKEESKALTLHSYLTYKKSIGESPRYYKDEILERYAGDQEVALILSSESA